MSIHIGRVIVKEPPMRPFAEKYDGESRTASLGGILFGGAGLDYTRDRVAEFHDNLIGLSTMMVPISFDDKEHRDGYYLVEAGSSSLTELPEQDVLRSEWACDLRRLGSASEVDLESRFAGPLTRTTDHGLVGVRWHTPPGAHTAYWAAASSPGSILRTGTDGPLRTYLGVGFGINPRWQCEPDGYELGRVRFLNRTERTGIVNDPSPTDWLLSNSLLSVRPIVGGGVGVWAAGATEKVWNLTQGGTPLGDPVAAQLLYNDYERVTVRLLWNRSPVGRTTCDLTLKRGSRFVEILLQASTSSTLGVVQAVSEAGTGATGYVRATSNDGDGHRYIVGSSKTFTGDTGAGGISKASVVKLDAFVGLEIGGSAAVAGDQAADLMQQYLASPVETVVAVRR
jgi:hypothetical protein